MNSIVRLVFAGLLITPSTNALDPDDPVVVRSAIVLECIGKRSVGYSPSVWSPTVFDGHLRFKIEETKRKSGHRYWDVFVMYNEWAFLGGESPTDHSIFMTTGPLTGRHFVLDVKSMRFSFVDSFAYFYDRSSDASAHMSIGDCRKPAASRPNKG
jgi:hypothetical protein